MKYAVDDTIFYAKVQFYFQATIHNQIQTLALVSDYSPPDLGMLRQTHETLWTCRYPGAEALQVINVKNIHAVVAIVPFSFDQTKFFVGKKIGLEVAALGGIEEEDIAHID